MQKHGWTKKYAKWKKSDTRHTHLLFPFYEVLEKAKTQRQKADWCLSLAGERLAAKGAQGSLGFYGACMMAHISQTHRTILLNFTECKLTSKDAKKSICKNHYLWNMKITVRKRSMEERTVSWLSSVHAPDSFSTWLYPALCQEGSTVLTMSAGSLGLLPRAGLGPWNAPAGDLKGGKKGREEREVANLPPLYPCCLSWIHSRLVVSLDQVYTSDLAQELCVWITAASPARRPSGPGVGRKKLLLAQRYCSVFLLLLYFVQLFVNTTFLCLKFPNLNGFICFLTETLTDTEPTHNSNKKEKNTLKLTRNCRSCLKNTSKSTNKT